MTSCTNATAPFPADRVNAIPSALSPTNGPLPRLRSRPMHHIDGMEGVKVQSISRMARRERSRVLSGVWRRVRTAVTSHPTLGSSSPTAAPMRSTLGHDLVDRQPGARPARSLDRDQRPTAQRLLGKDWARPHGKARRTHTAGPLDRRHRTPAARVVVLCHHGAPSEEGITGRDAVTERTDRSNTLCSASCPTPHSPTGQS